MSLLGHFYVPWVRVKSDGGRLKVVISTPCFHYKMSGRLKKSDSKFCV